MDGFLVIDKPSDWTSHDVIAKLRGILQTKRIGHGGTLDPMATGVLPMFIGKATKAVEFFENADKEYMAALRLGAVTDTQDKTGTIISQTDHSITSAELSAILKCFTGAQKQTPPMYSAVKIGGKKLYELARRGKTIDRPQKDIFVHTLELTGEQNGDFLLRVVCSKGTYVRTLCHDIGAKLGCGGLLADLRRTRAGVFSISDAHTLQSVIEHAENNTVKSLIKPTDTLFQKYPKLTLDETQTQKSMNGVKMQISAQNDGQYRVYSKDNSFLMFGEIKNGVLSSIKTFWN